LSDDRIFFNGQYETFVVQRCHKKNTITHGEGVEYFSFCKTAMKEYDPVVVACLLVLDHVLATDPVGFQWSSDGDWPNEHSMGIELTGLPLDDLRGPRD